MKLKLLRTLALAALMAATAGVAHATEGWYGRADLGWSIDAELDVDGGSFDFDHDLSEHLGLGYAFSNGLRLEGEVAHRFNDFQDLDGHARAWSAMVNLYYDFNRGGRVEPYIGVGVGAARVEAKGAVGPISFDDEDTVFAYQGAVGFAVALTEQLDLDIGYRYFEAPDAGFNGAVDFEGPEPFNFDGDYSHQAVSVGLRYQFAAPAPAPVQQPQTPSEPPVVQPPVVVCPTSAFVIYFEWDRSNLNQAALETIDAAVTRVRECNLANVVVVGHTDTSGSAQYNIGLSERRAAVVRDALAARGIAAQAITTEARGETDLAQATRDGVREPLNRRTAVTISFR
jgi:outer membrane protein OmpA-like peptidoglycan-associated protein/outer membrane protein W